MSRGARGYYWKVVVPAIAQYQGEARYRDVHRWLKSEFLPCDDDEGSSTKVALLPHDEYVDYVRRIVIWARIEGIEIPMSWHEED